MVSLKNTTGQRIDGLVVGKNKDGSPKTESIEPGETKDLDVAGGKDNPVVKGHLIAGTLSTGRTRDTTVASAPTKTKT